MPPRTWAGGARLALPALLAAAACEPAALSVHSQAIVGGSPAAGEPAVVALHAEVTLDDGSSAPVLCTGALIAPRIVLTAAHCLDRIGTPEVHVAYFGDDLAAFLRDGEDPTLVAAIEVVELAYNPAFTDVPIEALHEGNDIGLVRLAEDAPVTPIALGRIPLESLAGAAIRLVGFGSDGSLEDEGGIKREATATLDEVTEGLAFYGDPATHRPYANTCAGDSGGPVLMEVGGREVIIGITSFGDASCHQYGAATRVDRHVEPLITPFLGDGPVCARDGTCEDGCPVPDPDCDPGRVFGTATGGCRAGGGSPSLLLLIALLVVLVSMRRPARGRTTRGGGPPWGARPPGSPGIA